MGETIIHNIVVEIHDDPELGEVIKTQCTHHTVAVVLEELKGRKRMVTSMVEKNDPSKST